VKLSEQDFDFLRLYSFASKKESEREREREICGFLLHHLPVDAWWIFTNITNITMDK